MTVTEYSEWSVDDLVAARKAALARIQDEINRLGDIQRAIAAQGKTRRKMMVEGVPWVGY